MTGSHICGFDTGATNGVTTVAGHLTSTKDGVTTSTPVDVGINGKGQIVSIYRSGADVMTPAGASSTPNNGQASSVGAQNQTVGERPVAPSPLAGPPSSFADSLEQRLNNFGRDGITRFDTDEQRNAYIAAAATAKLQGGDQALASFFRENSPISGTISLIELAAGGSGATAVRGASTFGELGTASFTAKNGVGLLYSPKVVISGNNIVFTDFAVGTARGMLGIGERGGAELLGPLRQLVAYSQQQGAKTITLSGRYVTEEGARLGGGQVGSKFSYTFSANEAGIKNLFEQLRK
jgi:hypothetical protein